MATKKFDKFTRERASQAEELKSYNEITWPQRLEAC